MLNINEITRETIMYMRDDDTAHLWLPCHYDKDWRLRCRRMCNSKSIKCSIICAVIGAVFVILGGVLIPVFHNYIKKEIKEVWNHFFFATVLSGFKIFILTCLDIEDGILIKENQIHYLYINKMTMLKRIMFILNLI